MSFSLFLLALSIISTSLTISGVIFEINNITFLGLLLFTFIILMLLLFTKKLKTILIIYILTLISFTLALSYESISNYPLGADIHGEYLIVKNSLKLGKVIFSSEKNLIKTFITSPYYHDIFSYIISTMITSLICGINVVLIIKFFWNVLVLGLIPLIVFLYVKEKYAKVLSAFIGSIFIFIQSTYITTLHSTSKQVLSLFLVTIFLLLLSKFIKDYSHSYLFTNIVLVILSITYSSYHYFTSGIFITVSLLGLGLLFLHHIVSLSIKMKPMIYTLLIVAIVWFLIYFLITGSMITPLINLIKQLFSMQPKTYGYENIHISLPRYLNILRLTINGIISLTIGMAGLKSLSNLWKGKGNLIESLTLASVFLFISSSITEILNITTIGIGRFFIIYIIITSPYLYDGFTLLSSIFIKKRLLTLLFLIFVLCTRFLLSTGALPYIFGDSSYGVFFDTSYKIATSPINTDISSTLFINKYCTQVTIGTDIKGAFRFYYVNDLKLNITIVKNYFAQFHEKKYRFPPKVIYLSSFNLVLSKIQISVNKFSNVKKYLPLLYRSNNLIYNNLKSMIFY